ncbi:unnamed protein product [Lactuca saligna]|uniref:Uncharacterized protein n=1 Tax=Lactuca saligna TaxID=75948 RepID=A0AA35VQS5_LACSI|nr:unnamed protein product [Lactuca saligna]
MKASQATFADHMASEGRRVRGRRIRSNQASLFMSGGEEQVPGVTSSENFEPVEVSEGFRRRLEVRTKEWFDGENQSTRSRPSGVYSNVNNRERNKGLKITCSAPVSFLLHLFFIFEISSKRSVLCVLLHENSLSTRVVSLFDDIKKIKGKRGVWGLFILPKV